MKIQRILCCALLTASVHAGSSASYTIVTGITDAGGRRGSSTSYTQDSSVGAIAGISAAVTPPEVVKSGYLGQLSEPTGLRVTTPALTLNETAAAQLSAWLTLDDASVLAVPATSVAWSAPLGPLSINAAGLATAGAVYQNTAATAQASYSGLTGSLGLTVLDTIADNFGSYAGDGLGDDWQVQYFGQNNAQAGPIFDPDGDGQNNAFEYTAGLVPTDANSRFLLNIVGTPQKQIVFSPVVDGRSYAVEYRASLTSDPSWQTLTTVTTPPDSGVQRTVTDTDASSVRKFYQVKISKP